MKANLPSPVRDKAALSQVHQLDQSGAEHAAAAGNSSCDGIAMAIAEYRAKYAIKRAQRERDRRVYADRRMAFDPLRVLTLGYDRRSGIDRRQMFDTVVR